MSEYNKSYRIRTKIGVNENSPIEDKYLTVKLTERIDSIDIMSLKIKQENAYRFHAADYGVVVGRAIANGGFGVPNVKVSVFIAASEATVNDPIYNAIYPYNKPTKKNKDNIRYNLLPDVAEDDCYQVVGTFPNKRLVLDDDNYLEIYDTYYKFTTRTNSAGDYMIFGVPTGGQILHFDVDLSDVGVLSQKPRDMIYKGYNEKQFENPNQFKKDDNLANLPQIISQDESVYVYPFWGDEDENIIGITRHDIDINYKFEPTCVFMGSLITDTNSNRISKKCIPTDGMGLMEDVVTGPGKIEMIRKKQDGSVEQFNIQGTLLVNDNGVWCYQIPMNLDYVMTDEYGNLVPSDDPTKGIATRAKVRFRFSMDEFEDDSLNSFRTKVLVPNNPQNYPYDADYVFGSFTEEDSFRDLLWNNVYTVKSFIPRFQKGNGNRNRRFSGIKQCNYHGQNNPIPYNNMRINLSFQFVIVCLIVRLLIWAVGAYNAFITALSNLLSGFVNSKIIKSMKKLNDWLNNVSGNNSIWEKILSVVITILVPGLREIALILSAISDFFSRMAATLSCVYLDGSMCEALEGSWFFAPNCGKKNTAGEDPNFYIWKNMMAKIEGKRVGEMDFSAKNSKSGGGMEDKHSTDNSNADNIGDNDNEIKIETESGESISYQYVISRGIDYFVQCVEISLAMEYRVIQFDFYNDWINGMIYIPRWERSLKKKRKYFLFGKSYVEVRACNDTYKKRFFERKNYLTEQCGVSYRASSNQIASPLGCKSNSRFKCHKKAGRKQFNIFSTGGVVHEEPTSSGLYAYYFKPCEYVSSINAEKGRKVNLFATDLVLLGSLVDCDLNGTPVFTNELQSTTYQIPSPLAHTDSTEEGFTYTGQGNKDDLLVDENGVLTGVFDVADSILSPQDDGSVTEESGIDWGYTGPAQGEPVKGRGYTPGGHFLGISCVNSESMTKSCVNLKRICEIGVWPSQRQEVFNGYKNEGNEDDEKVGTYLDIIPNGLISKDDISGGNFRKIFSTMNQNGLKTKINESGFTVYDFTYMDPEMFGGEFSRYTRTNYNDPQPIPEESMERYYAVNGSKNDYGETYSGTSELNELSIKPIRRSLEERDSDYMRFRLGINKDANNPLLTKYLGIDDYGYYMPVYNNSFYFYFGLVPGSTALEEFHKQFFAECKSTMSTRDMRLDLKLHYSDVCCGGKPCEDAFESPVEVEINKDGIKFVSGDYLRIYSTAIPIKIVVDAEKEYVIRGYNDTNIKDSGGDFSENIYIDFIGNPENMFDFEIGKHTVRVTDANGKTITKLVEVVSQSVTSCVNIVGVPFTKDDYIVNETKSLIDGTADNRDLMGGWFSFDWSNSTCEDNCVENKGVFSFYEYRNCVPGELKCVTVNDLRENYNCMLFVGKSHIIKIGGASILPRSIIRYKEFSKFSEDDIISGRIISTDESTYVYAGEEGEYDFYIMYGDGLSVGRPILLQDGIYIGEPAAIDFDIFREVIESESESPITFRNPIVKSWCKNPSNWLKNVGDYLTEDQKWYVRKVLFYVLTGKYDESKQFPEDINENFTSERTLYVNLYYPSSVGNVDYYINGGKNIALKKTCKFKEGNWRSGKTISNSTSMPFKIMATGSTINEDGQEIVVYTPMREYDENFKFFFYFKPYYYKAVIWEGYSAIQQGQRGSYGEINGTIYNGITYVNPVTRRHMFGPTLLNDRYNVKTSVTDVGWYDDFTSERKTKMSQNVTGSTFTEGTNSLLITEGAPKEYYESYTPVEYRIETNALGPSVSWYLDLLCRFLKEAPFIEDVPTEVQDDVDYHSHKDAKIDVQFENDDYEKVNWYWINNADLNNDADFVENSIKTIEFDELSNVIFETGGDADTTGATGNFTIYGIPQFDGQTGDANPITNGVLMAESVRNDNLKYSNPVSLTPVNNLGFLASRNFIRNGINVNYEIISSELNNIWAFIAVSDLCTESNNHADIDFTGNAWAAVTEYGADGKRKYGGLGVLILRIKLPFADQAFKQYIGKNIESVKIKGFEYNKDTGECYELKEVDLINDLGYMPEYNNGDWLTFRISEGWAENGSVFDHNYKVVDEFTTFLEDYYCDHIRGWAHDPNAHKWFYNGKNKSFPAQDHVEEDEDTRIAGINVITLRTGNIGGTTDGKNDVLNSIEIKYNSLITYKLYGENPGDQEGD